MNTEERQRHEMVVQRKSLRSKFKLPSVQITSSLTSSNDSDDSATPRLTRKEKCQYCWNNFKFFPTSPFKIKWDMLVIVLSIWNSISIPYELAFPDAFEEEMGFLFVDYIIDSLFAFDIFINFRSVYKDPKTEESVTDGKKIAMNYAFKGRFLVDLLASTPFELFGLMF